MLVGGNKSTNQHLTYTKLFSDSLCYYKYFEICFVKIGATLDFNILYKLAMTFDLHMAIMLHMSKTKHWRCIKLNIFGFFMTRQTIWHYFQRNQSMFKFFTRMELSRSMAAILKMLQYHIRKMLLMLCLYSLPNLTLLTNTAQSRHFLVLSCPTKHIHCAQNVKTVKLCTEFTKSLSNIFQICQILQRFQDGCHWPWEFHVGQKIEKCSYCFSLINIMSLMCLYTVEFCTYLVLGPLCCRILAFADSLELKT